jgi:hypothetical protein
MEKNRFDGVSLTYSAKEIAILAKLSTDWARNIIKAGVLPHLKESRVYKVPCKFVHRYLEGKDPSGED